MLVLYFGRSTERPLCFCAQGIFGFSPTPLAGLLSTCTGNVAGFSACGPQWQQSRLCCDAPKAWCRAFVHQADIYETTRDCGGYSAGRSCWTGQPHSMKAPGKQTGEASGKGSEGMVGEGGRIGVSGEGVDQWRLPSQRR